MGQIGSLFCLILAANADTVLLAAGWAMGHRYMTASASLLLAGSTSVLTAMALWAGQQTAFFFPAEGAKNVAAALLIILGLWMIIRSFREKVPEPVMQPMTAGETLLLGGILAANNMGMGFAAGLAGMPSLCAGLLNFLVSLLCLRLGSQLGRRSLGAEPGRWADILSGALLILLGAAAKII